MKFNLAIVNTLAAKIRNASSMNRSESMKAAYTVLRQSPEAQTLIFKKLDGKVEHRIVSKNWTKFQAPKGGRSNLACGQIVFADLCKVATGEANCIISAYENRIIYQSAA